VKNSIACRAGLLQGKNAGFLHLKMPKKKREKVKSFENIYHFLDFL
jgi:hypothetical protein